MAGKAFSAMKKVIKTAAKKEILRLCKRQKTCENSAPKTSVFRYEKRRKARIKNGCKSTKTEVLERKKP